MVVGLVETQQGSHMDLPPFQPRCAFRKYVSMVNQQSPPFAIWCSRVETSRNPKVMRGLGSRLPTGFIKKKFGSLDDLQNGTMDAACAFRKTSICRNAQLPHLARYNLARAFHRSDRWMEVCSRLSPPGSLTACP